MHDDRCEADWNDGICACAERAEPPLQLHRPPRTGRLDRLRGLLTLNR